MHQNLFFSKYPNESCLVMDEDIANKIVDTFIVTNKNDSSNNMDHKSNLSNK